MVQSFPWTCSRVLCLLRRAFLYQEQLVSRSRMRAIGVTYKVIEQECVCFAGPQVLNMRMTFVGRWEDMLKVVLAEVFSTRHTI